MKRSLSCKKSIYFLFISLLTLSFLACTEQNKIDDKAFATTENIDHIFMVKSSGEKVDLLKKEGHWIVNEQYPIRQEMMDILLKTIKKVKVNYPVAKKQQDDIIKQIAAEHVKVELYQEKKLIKTYFVGSHTQDMMGTYFYMDKGERPYVCFIPGFDGYLTPRFFTSEEEWRSRVVFSMPRINIKKVSIQYDEKLPALESFSLLQENDQIRIKNLKNEEEKDISDSETAKQYLSFFERLEIEGFDNDNSKKDSIIKSKPFCTIELTNQANETKSVDLYYMDLNQRSKTQFDRKGNKLKYDLDRLYASFNQGKDFGVVQFFVFGKLFQTYPSF